MRAAGKVRWSVAKSREGGEEDEVIMKWYRRGVTLIGEMGGRGMPPSEVAYNTMLDICAKVGCAILFSRTFAAVAAYAKRRVSVS